MKIINTLCLLTLLTASAEVAAQRPNRPLFPLQAYTLTDYEAIEYSEAFEMPEAFEESPTQGWQ